MLISTRESAKTQDIFTESISYFLQEKQLSEGLEKNASGLIADFNLRARSDIKAIFFKGVSRY